MSYDYYHPRWDHHQNMSKDEYLKTLEALSSATASTPLIVTDKALEVTTKGQQLWNRFKGFFGFEDRTEIVRVNYELLKFLRYGERFHYNDACKDMLENLKNHASVGKTVSECLRSLKDLDSYIENYHSQHEKELRPSFWSRTVEKPKEISQIFNYSMSRIDAANKNWESAISRLKTCTAEDAPIHLAKASVELYATRGDVSVLNEALESLETLSPELKSFLETQELMSSINEKRAEFYCEKKEFSEAIKAYDQVKNKGSQPWVKTLYLGLIAQAAQDKNNDLMKASLNGIKERGFCLTAEELEPVIGGLYRTGSYKRVADLAQEYGDDMAIVDLAKQSQRAQNFEAAVCFYEKARAFPRVKHENLSSELAACYRKLDRLEEAEKVLSNDDTSSVEERTKLAIAQGKRVQAEIASDPQTVKKKVVDFVAGIRGSEIYQDVVSALGMFRGENSSQNQAFLQLGQNAETFDAILEDGRQAIALITSAYDGRWGHNAPEDMPTELVQELKQLTKMVDDMARYHADSKKDVQELAAKAIEYNLKAYKANPDNYGEHLNRLVEAYFQRGEYATAIKTFEELKEKFFSHPITINQDAYSREAERLLALHQFKNCFELLAKAIERFSENVAFRKLLSHTYFVTGKAFEQKGNIESALSYYNKALECGVDAEAACYAALAAIKQAPFEKEETQSREAFDKVVELRKKAMETDPLKAEYAFEYGRFLYFNDLQHAHDPLSSLQRAVELEPDNITYLYGLLMATRQAHRPQEEVNDVFVQFKAKGGDIGGNYWEPQRY